MVLSVLQLLDQPGQLEETNFNIDKKISNIFAASGWNLKFSRV